ncbi:MAG: uracil permease [Enterocloster asparagiformis]|nr:uracil permease [Enterocloster asparagiformis]
MNGNTQFKYRWWGKGDIDASIGIFFDGFSKILTATGIMTVVFGMPAKVVIGKVVPGIGLAILLGNLWYFYEARCLAHKEKRHNVTSQPFGIGASQLSGWLYLIIGPVYWQTGDSGLALQVGLAAAFVGGLVEVAGGFAGRWIVETIPNSALMGNMASSAMVWLSIVGLAMVFDKPVYAVLPLFIIIIDYLGKADKRFAKIPSGMIAILIGTAVAWACGYLTPGALKDSFSEIGFYPPSLGIGDIAAGFKGIVPYLPVIIPLQINNFLSTLQGLESAKMAGDVYPERRSMIMDGVSTMTGALFGNPFPTTVYFGHPGWKELDARAGFSLVNGFLCLIICTTGLTGVLMALIPTEAVMVLLIFIGFSVTDNTFRSMDKKYYNVILLSMIPILFQYVQTLISSSVQAAGLTMAAVTAEQFAAYSVPIQGIMYLGNGGFLTSLLLAGLLACVVDRRYKMAGAFALVMAFCAAIGMIHCEGIALLTGPGVIFGTVYLTVAALLFMKGHFFEPGNGQRA